METIEYKGKQYPTRLFIVDNPEFGENQTIRIATDSLFEAFGGAYEIWDSEEHKIDNEIYFYVEDEVIELPPLDICKNHLDIPMKFIEEIIE